MEAQISDDLRQSNKDYGNENGFNGNANHRLGRSFMEYRKYGKYIHFMSQIRI